MFATKLPGRDPVASNDPHESKVSLAWGPLAPARAREHVRDARPSELSAARMCDLVLLTSELVTNAYEHSRAGPLDLNVIRAATFTRIEVSNPGESWAKAPEASVPDPDQIGGWGLFLVEQISDRWGSTDTACTVWFEFDHPLVAS